MKTLTLTLLALAVAPRAYADGRAADDSLAVDLEVDPIAYVVGGHSVHVGLRWGRLRLDLGAFAAEVPEALHGVDGVEVYMSGFGLKADYRPFDGAPGFFVGAQGGLAREAVRAADSGVADSKRHVSVGGRVGYEMNLPAGLYVAPWLGVEAVLGERKAVVGGRTYDPGRVIVFPTIHLGKTL